MLLTLLLQSPVVHTTTITASDLTNVYIALGGTLAAAILAAIASFRASSKASITAEKVAVLTTQTTKDVAALSAQVARESASLAARTAQELKVIDYKNDFYKKLIERRLKAWEKSEELMLLLTTTLLYKGDLIFYFFGKASDFDHLMEKIRSMAFQSYWMGREYSVCVNDFYDKLLLIRNECLVDEKPADGELPAINNSLLKQAGVKYASDCNEYRRKLLLISNNQIKKLHDLDSYFNQLPTF
jgi:hypothetical protein